MNIAVVGTGYVGLVTGTCLAETGNQVVCIDVDKDKVERMKQGEVPIYEPGLKTLFDRNTSEGRLSFTTSLAEGYKDAEVVFFALPTPPNEDGSADLSYVLRVAEDLSDLIDRYTVIVGKSTVPVGTADQVEAVLQKKVDPSLFDVVSNPEFLREGVAVDDFLKPERVIIGTESQRAREIMERLYKPFVRQGNPIYFMDVRSAEMTKYAANSFLATKITFMNEMANLCERLGANIDQVRIGIGSDSRIGKRFLFPGVGYGGSCFPKDVKALIQIGEENNYDLQILKSVDTVNDRQKMILAEKIARYFDEDLYGKVIGVWGLAFKPNTDDIREAPSLYILEQLLDKGAVVKAYDPEAMDNIRRHFGDRIQLVRDAYEALIEVDALAIITEWSVFRTPNFKVMKSLMKQPVIFDGRNLYEVDYMEEKGFYYESVGRRTTIL
ncbi:MAG TPA: UDP-glucose/GDP-mannose dehydrogenase family protein [Membranihabitans sp.]|nr:UDP-glucose/GDP-mannose dehydrogenase family protein [Membranihabitans sp.]